MRFVRPVLNTVGTFSVTIRDMGRLNQVAMILAAHGLGILFRGLSIPGITNTRKLKTTPERLSTAIQSLGPTFIKFGQILSTRPDVIPDAYVEAFQNLQDDVKALPYSGIEKELIRNFGEGWMDSFKTFDQVPLATASIAQVHRAKLKDGSEVVLKVQRPGITKEIHSDLNIMEFILNRALTEFPEIEIFDPRGIFLEFRKSIIAELDFQEEVKNLKNFRINFHGRDDVRWPLPYEEFCTQNILCMEYLDGEKIRLARENGFDMEVIGRRYLQIAYSMLFEHGFFHGDLHPGNVLVLEGNVIGILDCGMVGRLTVDMKSYLASLIYSLHRGDTRTVARLFFDISIKEKRIDYAEFERDAIEVAEKHWSGGGFREMDIVSFLMDLSKAALRHRVRATPAFTMFFKGVMTTEGLAKSLLPEVDPLEAAQPYVESLLKDRWSPESLGEAGMQNLAAYTTIARRLPISISQMLDDLDHQRLRFQIEQFSSEEELQHSKMMHGNRDLVLMSMVWLLFGGLFLLNPMSIMDGEIWLGPLGLGLGIGMQVFVLWRMWKN